MIENKKVVVSPQINKLSIVMYYIHIVFIVNNNNSVFSELTMKYGVRIII